MNVNQEFYVAQICLSGHLISSLLSNRNDSQKDFCDICGEKTFVTCQSCNIDIRGKRSYGSMPGPGKYTIPNFCIHCGQAYPWVAERLKAAEELADLIDEMSDEDKRLLTKTFNDLVRETPRSQVAALQFKKVVSQTEQHIKAAFRDILLDVVTEPVKKLLFG